MATYNGILDNIPSVGCGRRSMTYDGRTLALFTRFMHTGTRVPPQLKGDILGYGKLQPPRTFPLEWSWTKPKK